MGYTHYFGPTDFKPTDFKLLIVKSREVIRIVTEEMEIPLAYEYDETDKPPVCEGETIRFNGVDDDGHETFMLEQNSKWTFCKTACKPYDIAVVAILCLAHHYTNYNGSVALHVSSDGDVSDWEDGLELARRIEPNCQMPFVDEE